MADYLVLIRLLRVFIFDLFFLLISLLFYADFKNAICFWRSHLVFSYKKIM